MSEQVIVAPQEGSQSDFMNSPANITIFGGAAGSGKSRCLLMDCLKYIHDPKFYGVYIRKTNTQLEMSLWREAKEIYPMFGGKFHGQKMTVTFPSGAEIKFAYFELEKHKDNYQGAEFSAILLDEGTQFTADKVFYLKSRMRSKAENASYMKITCNPDRDHFLYDWVKFFLYEHDQVEEDGSILLEKMKGCPNRKFSGKLRYFVIVQNELVSAWTKEELIEENPYIKLSDIRTYTFIAGTIDDNPIMDEIEPSYRTDLDNLPRIEKLRLRYGNWHVRPEGSGYFERKWTPILPLAPRQASRVRSWDFAGTLPSDICPDPDWTVGTLMSKTKESAYLVEDVIRFRSRPDGVEKCVLETALSDGVDVLVTIPVDPGSAGVTVAQMLARKLAEQGNSVKLMKTRQNKITRFNPFSSICESGSVSVLRAPWNDYFFLELEGFTGDKHDRDDVVDSVSDAFMTLATKKFIGAFALETFSKANPFKRRDLV